MHQECYGVKDVQDFTSWVCRACETPDVIRECCLCPVKGILPLLSWVDLSYSMLNFCMLTLWGFHYTTVNCFFFFC